MGRLGAVADCSTSRKACKDCTCGRAEDEAAGAPPPQLTKEVRMLSRHRIRLERCKCRFSHGPYLLPRTI